MAQDQQPPPIRGTCREPRRPRPLRIRHRFIRPPHRQHHRQSRNTRRQHRSLRPRTRLQPTTGQPESDPLRHLVPQALHSHRRWRITQPRAFPQTSEDRPGPRLQIRHPISRKGAQHPLGLLEPAAPPPVHTHDLGLRHLSGPSRAGSTGQGHRTLPVDRRDRRRHLPGTRITRGQIPLIARHKLARILRITNRPGPPPVQLRRHTPQPIQHVIGIDGLVLVTVVDVHGARRPTNSTQPFGKRPGIPVRKRRFILRLRHDYHGSPELSGIREIGRRVLKILEMRGVLNVHAQLDRIR